MDITQNLHGCKTFFLLLLSKLPHYLDLNFDTNIQYSTVFYSPILSFTAFSPTLTIWKVEIHRSFLYKKRRVICLVTDPLSILQRWLLIPLTTFLGPEIFRYAGTCAELGQLHNGCFVTQTITKQQKFYISNFFFQTSPRRWIHFCIHGTYVEVSPRFCRWLSKDMTVPRFWILGCHMDHWSEGGMSRWGLRKESVNHLLRFWMLML